jgi:hypothetical protein
MAIQFKNNIICKGKDIKDGSSEASTSNGWKYNQRGTNTPLFGTQLLLSQAGRLINHSAKTALQGAKFLDKKSPVNFAVYK